MTILIQDSFNRTDNATSLGSADTGQAWTVYEVAGANTVYGIASNQARRFTGTVNNHFVGFNVANADVKMTVTFATNTANNNYVVFRATSANNYLMLQNKSTKYDLYYYNGTTWTTLGSALVTPANGDIVEITTNGASIVVKINTVQQLSITSTQNQTATIYGISGANSTLPRFDNFLIESLTAGTPTTLDGSANIIGVGVSTSSGRILKNSLVGLNGYGVLSGDSLKINNSGFSLLGVGLLQSSGNMIQMNQVSLLGRGLLQANSFTVQTLDGSVLIKGNGVFSPASSLIKYGSLSVLGSGLLLSDAIRMGEVIYVDGKFNLIGKAYLNVNGILIEVDNKVFTRIYLKGMQESSIYLNGKDHSSIYLKGLM